MKTNEAIHQKIMQKIKYYNSLLEKYNEIDEMRMVQYYSDKMKELMDLEAWISINAEY